MKKNKIALLFILAAICCGCDEFLEKDLSGKSIQINAPINGVDISGTTVTFWWDKVDGAQEYQLQVVSPSFIQAQKLWADTIVADNKLMLSLVPGNFEWRIKATNGSSETDFVTSAFSIDNSQNLINSNIVLRSPKDGVATNSLQQTFQWDALHNATAYHFKIIDATDDILKEETLQNTEISYTFLTDGTYKWSVRGQNELSNTPYTLFTLQIDTKSPVAPTLTAPEDNATSMAADSVLFSWTRAADTGSTLYDSLYVFADAELTDKILSKKLEQPSYGDLFEAGRYYWVVKTCDIAGNVSGRSSVFCFIKN